MQSVLRTHTHTHTLLMLISFNGCYTFRGDSSFFFFEEMYCSVLISSLTSATVKVEFLACTVFFKNYKKGRLARE